VGPDLAGALARTYAAVDEIDWPGKIYRRDIGRGWTGPASAAGS
jgi:hypothetical protein